jgi:predicted nucleic acid-binding protein
VRYLLDTDVLIDNQRGRPYATTWLADRAADGLAVSVVSVAELYIGAYRQTDPQAHLRYIRSLLAILRVVELDVAIVERFAREHADLRHRGQLIPDFDLLIAATALEANLTLVTRNRRHFERINGIMLEVIEP